MTKRGGTMASRSRAKRAQSKRAQSSPVQVRQHRSSEQEAKHKGSKEVGKTAPNVSVHAARKKIVFSSEEEEDHDTHRVKRRKQNPAHATSDVEEDRHAHRSRSNHYVGAPASRAPMSRWQPPHVNFERKSQFCMTMAEAHEVYNLNCAGKDPRLLNEEDFSDKDWLQVFTEVPKRGSKVKCRFVRKEFWSKFYSMFTSVYQEPPGNYGMEVTKAFARGFLYEHLRGAVNWAAFAESIVANMESSKLQLKKQRWAAFHSSIALQSSRRMTVVSNVEDGDASKGPGLQNVAKFFRLGNLSLNELDDVGKAVALSQENALTQYHEKCKKRDAMQANVHRNEGAMSIIQSVTKQLAQAKHRLGELQSSGAGSADVDRERARLFKFQMTLETLQAEVGDDDCSSELLEINREIAMMDEIIPIHNARVDFVNAMKRRKSPVHLQVPAPKVPPPNAEITQVPDSCSACGLLMYDEEALGIFILPCKHAYHIYCFANLAGREGKCLAASCGHVIPDNIKELMFIDSGGDTDTGCLKFGKQNISLLIYIWQFPT